MGIFTKSIQEYMDIASVSYTPFGTNMQSQNEFRLQPNSLFARNFHWTRGVTLNHDKRRWVTGLG